MVLNEREIKILEKLYFENKLKINELSYSFNVSNRMIRYNISKINELLEYLKLDPIIKNKEGFYTIKNKSPKILELIKELEPMDKSKKINLIKLIIAFSNKIITVEYLSKVFKTTRTSINNYIKEINFNNGVKIINKNGLNFVGKQNDILDYKIKILSIVINELNEAPVNKYIEIIQNLIFSILDKEEYKKIKNFSLEYIEKFEIKINELNFNLYLSKLIYSYIYKHNFIENYTKVLNTDDYEYIKNKLNYSEDTILNFMHISIWLKEFNDYKKDYESTVNIEIISKDIVKTVGSKLNCNNIDDQLLNSFLVEHFKSMVYSIKKGYIRNIVDIGKENKVKDKLYEIIENCLIKYEKILNINIKEDEIYLIRLHFLASIERNNNKNKYEKIYIITNLGEGSKKIISEIINSKFIVNIEYINNISDVEEKIIKNDNLVILSTTNISKEYKNKIIKINSIPTEEDLNKLKLRGIKPKKIKIIMNDLIQIIEKYSDINNVSKLKEELKHNYQIIDENNENILINDILEENNILLNYETDSLENAIIESLKLLEKSNYINKTYTNEVIQIYTKNPMYIIKSNNIIIPHTKDNNNVKKTGMSILKLKKPLLTNDTGEEIDTIVSFAIKDNKEKLNIISNMIINAFNYEFRLKLETGNKELIKQFLENGGL